MNTSESYIFRVNSDISAYLTWLALVTYRVILNIESQNVRIQKYYTVQLT